MGDEAVTDEAAIRADERAKVREEVATQFEQSAWPNREVIAAWVRKHLAITAIDGEAGDE